MSATVRRLLNLALAAATLAALAAGPARADSRHQRMGARPRAMGSAFVSLSDDPNAVLWNPAGLRSDDRLAAMVTRHWLYDVATLENDMLSLTFPAWHGVSLGAGFIRLGIEDIYHEDTYLLSAAADVPWLRGLAVGASGKLLRLAAPGYERYGDPAYDGGDTGFALDLGWLYDSGANWRLGGVVTNLNEPYLQLLATTTDPDPVYSGFAVGGSYLFRDTLLLTADLRSREGGWDSVALHGGAEIWFYDALALRAGYNVDQVTMGFGLQDVHWEADFSLETHKELGNVYMLSFTVRN